MKSQLMRPSTAGAFLFQLSVLLGIALPGLLVAVQGTAAEPGPAETKYAVDKGILYLPQDSRPADDYANEMCRLDLYRPEGVKGFPTIVFYHGGGLTGGQRCVPAGIDQPRMGGCRCRLPAPPQSPASGLHRGCRSRLGVDVQEHCILRRRPGQDLRHRHLRRRLSDRHGRAG